MSGARVYAKVEGSISPGSKFLAVFPNGGIAYRLWCLNVIALGVKVPTKGVRVPH